MKNRIWINGVEIIGKEKCGNISWLILEDKEKRKSSTIYNKPIEIECHRCQKKTDVKFYAALFKREYICQSCVKKGANNQFFADILPRLKS